MAAAKIEAVWGRDLYDNEILIISKKRGKLNFDEVADLLRYSKYGCLQGNYAMLIRAGEETCGGSGWMDDEVPVGDEWVLYKVEQDEPCPICRELTPPFQWCPICGETLNGAGPNKQQAIENTEKLLGTMKKEAVHMIKSTEFQETRKAWYHSHLGSIDFARQMGLITEERRKQLYKEFEKELKGAE